MIRRLFLEARPMSFHKGPRTLDLRIISSAVQEFQLICRSSEVILGALCRVPTSACDGIQPLGSNGGIKVLFLMHSSNMSELSRAIRCVSSGSVWQPCLKPGKAVWEMISPWSKCFGCNVWIVTPVLSRPDSKVWCSGAGPLNLYLKNLLETFGLSDGIND